MIMADNLLRLTACSGKPKEPFRQNAFHTARHNLEFAAREFSKIDAMILVEPVSPVVVPGFYLSTLQSAIDLVCEIKADNVRVLFDFFHMQQTETSLTEAIARCGVLIGHVQFADTPERHEPGTGEVDFDAAFNMLRKVGYDGIVSAEYRPSLNTGDSLAWMKRFEGWSGNAHR
jgi:hydroxypyruvate isomerase